jgi:hypothetical protein
MITALLIATVALAQPAGTDTTFALQPGGRLVVEALNGSVVVRAWDRASIRVQAAHAAGAEVFVRQRGGQVTLEARRRSGRQGQWAPGPPPAVQYEVTVPRSFNVQVEGVNMPVTVHDVNGTIRISNVAGAVIVRGTRGRVELESVGGGITVDGVLGNIDVSTVNESIRLTGVRGAVSADAVNGNIIMRDIDAPTIRASTVNGAVDYAGAFHDGGRYYFGTHNGRVTLAVPEGINATVAVTARQGQVESTFPVPLSGTRDGRFSFTSGTGSATVEVESFNGSVRLVRPSR